MHIRYFGVVLFLLCLSYLPAQNKPFQFGFKGSFNLGWLSSSNEDYHNEGLHPGGSWGFAADFFIMENYSFTTGFDMLYLNGKMEYPEYYFTNAYMNPENGTITRKYKTQYIKIPLLFTMKTNDIKKLRYYGQIGFGLAFQVSAKSEDIISSNSGNDPYTESQNIYSDMRFTRESFILGAGVEIPLHKSTYVRTGITFDNAFLNVLKGNNSVDPDQKHNGRNSFIDVSASLFF